MPRLSPEEIEVNSCLNRAFRLIAQMAAQDVMESDRERIKRGLAKLGSFHSVKQNGVIPLEDALNVVDNELIPHFPNKSDSEQT